MQLCVFAKPVSVCGAGGISDCIFWVRLLKAGQNGVPNEKGNPRLAKSVQYPFMVPAEPLLLCGERLREGGRRQAHQVLDL